MIEFLKKAKRALVAWRVRVKTRREASRAFRYDRRQFMANAGALHLDRMSSARAEIVMGYHVLEKGLTMPHRRLGFGKGAVVHLVNLVDSFERRFGADDPQVTHAVAVLRAYRELHRDWPEPMPRLDAFLAARPDVPAAREPHVRRADFFAAKDAPFPEFAASRHVCRHFAGPVPRETVESAMRSRRLRRVPATASTRASTSSTRPRCATGFLRCRAAPAASGRTRTRSWW